MTPDTKPNSRAANDRCDFAGSQQIFETRGSSRSDGRVVLDYSRIEFALNYYRHLDNLRLYVEQQRGEPFRLADAAEKIGISTSRLSYIFHEKTGVLFSDWIRHLRIEQAQELLRNNDVSICDIALSVGYRNTRTFERAFRKTCGKSATRYRKDIMQCREDSESEFG